MPLLKCLFLWSDTDLRLKHDSYRAPYLSLRHPKRHLSRSIGLVELTVVFNRHRQTDWQNNVMVTVSMHVLILCMRCGLITLAVAAKICIKTYT